MNPVLVWPDPVAVDIVRALDLAGVAWKTTGNELSISQFEWDGAIVDGTDDPEGALTFCRRLRRVDGAVPVLLMVGAAMMHELNSHHDAFDDFVVSPFHPVEFEVRVRHVLGRSLTTESDVESVSYGPLALNLETYQATIDGRPLDLTYMEYELLKYLAQAPGRVHTRETLLSQVWGYEYYGGARTVDVHVRRLRSKLGEQHAGLISTVRSVGYRFGESRFADSP